MPTLLYLLALVRYYPLLAWGLYHYCGDFKGAASRAKVCRGTHRHIEERRNEKNSYLLEHVPCQKAEKRDKFILQLIAKKLQKVFDKEIEASKIEASK